MRFYLLYLMIAISTTSTSAQVITAEENVSENISLNSHEIKLNLSHLLLGFSEISWESNFGYKNISIALSVGRSLSTNNERYFNLALLPYARKYFGKELNSGFFIETNLIFLSIVEQEYRSTRNFNGKGGGFAIGVKYYRLNGLTAEVYLGGGRLLLSRKKNPKSLYPRFGIMIGKRFW